MTTEKMEMTTEEFLALLKARQIGVRANGERLKVTAPSGAIDARLQAELKARKTSLLEALRQSEAGAALVPSSAAALQGRIPLTPAQQGIWLIDHFNPGNVSYNIPEAFGFDEAIDLKTAQAAVNQLVARHAILRTSFHEEAGGLFQSIATGVESPVGFTDLSALPEEEGRRRCREAIREEGRRPFALDVAPLARFHLFRLAAQRHVIFFNIHHIIADRVSLYVIREELVALSRAVEGQLATALPEVRLQFADYAKWMALRMQGEAIKRQTAFWTKKLNRLPSYLELPHSLPWPKKRSSWGATRRMDFSAEDRAALNRIGLEEGASPFMTFLAVFAAMMARWSRAGRAGSRPTEPVDFCIGSPITQRGQEGTERMIGPFVNMLAFRCTIAPGMSFRELLRQVRGTALEGYENSDVPFQRLVKALKPDRRSQRSPIFQVMLGYETYLPPIAGEFQMDAAPGTARYDLSLHLAETAGEGLNGVIEYRTDLFVEADIVGLAALGRALVADIVGDPDGDVLGVALVAKACAQPTEPEPSSFEPVVSGPVEVPRRPHASRTKRTQGLLTQMFSLGR